MINLSVIFNNIQTSKIAVGTLYLDKIIVKPKVDSQANPLLTVPNPLASIY